MAGRQQPDPVRGGRRLSRPASGGQRRRAEVALDDAGRIHDLLTEAAAAPLPEGAGLTAERAEELIGHIRAGREAG